MDSHAYEVVDIMKLTAVALLSISLFSFASSSMADDCDINWWRRDIVENNVVRYYGELKKDSAEIVYVEVWQSRKLIGSSRSYVNPRGIFDVIVYTDKRVKKKSRPKFSCSSRNLI